MALVASVKRGEGAGVTEGMRKREADWLKEARALVSTRQAHERTHARTHTNRLDGQGGTGEQTHVQLQNTRTNSRWTGWKPANTTHTHTLTRTREREQVLFGTSKAKRNDAFFL
jgi:hypothetical protein